MPLQKNTPTNPERHDGTMMRRYVVPLVLAVSLGACGGAPMSDIRPLAVSLPARDPAVFNRLTDFVRALGYTVVEADPASGTFAITARRWAPRDERVRFVVQCTRDGFASIAVERHGAGAPERIESHRRGGTLRLPTELADEYRDLAIAMRELLHPPVGAASTPSTPDEPVVVDPVDPTVASRAPTVDGWPTTPQGRPEAIVDPHARRGRDTGRIVGGALTLAIGYLGAIIVAAVDEASLNCRLGPSYAPVACGSWPWALIPIAGPLAGGIADGSGSSPRINFNALWVQIPMVAMQIVGFSILLYAIGAPTLDMAEGFAIGETARLRIEPGAPSADVGVSAALDF